ncbi:Maf family protein [Sphingomicrobium sediminis]|uniref:Nucleoside triphosphate pyrophosphatase n=1 Tax=Sphingomicrobium sediminis TaxID=2950949 RepID=A0A9X2J2S9_9SPHN|nr:nucleoside triphosphate pyrophosphatase [Sphingomicrobium sediminis]MCM8558084.1 Maf family protein [Sphingomicrobium sediminis]
MALLLASTSPIRRAMLDQAGLDYGTASPDVDEDAVKARHEGSAAELALELARAKALSSSTEGDAKWVIGSDSVLEVGGKLFSKPGDRDEAAAHLRYFSGKVMQLTSAVALARDGGIDWDHADTARLVVRDLSDEFIAAYLDADWPEVSYCVGVFRMEGPGVTLFDRIDGNYFTILGLPLLPLLGALRARGEMLA